MIKEKKMQKLFQTARLNALYHWIELTGRDLNYTEHGNTIREEVADNFECKWQQKNWEIHKGTDKEDNHISIICSLNNWSSHISDILTDVSFDLVQIYHFPVEEEMTDEETGEKFEFDMYPYEKLMRHYGRFFLVVSELIVDFGDIAKKLGKNDFGNFYSENNVLDYGKLRGYINNVFKHKTNNFHRCNHHVPILFNDGFPPLDKYQSNSNEYMIEIGCSHEYSKKDVDYILRLPRMVDVIKFLGICYQKLDKLLDETGLIEISKEYGNKY
jgi:hypothetical protein